VIRPVGSRRGMADPSATKMVIPSNVQKIPAVQQAILEQARACAFTDRDVFSLRLAIEEAISNAVNHGNGGDPDKTVTIEYAVDHQRVWIRVTDEGWGFSPEALPDPRCEENLESPHGRGVLLMHAYMNEVHFNDRGNCVTLVKHREGTQ